MYPKKLTSSAPPVANLGSSSAAGYLCNPSLRKVTHIIAFLFLILPAIFLFSSIVLMTESFESECLAHTMMCTYDSSKKSFEDFKNCVAKFPDCAAVVAKYPNVDSVISGHLHRPATASWGGTVAFASPSTAAQVSPSFNGEGTSYTYEPGMLSLHWWTTEGIASHVQPIGDNGHWVPEWAK